MRDPNEFKLHKVLRQNKTLLPCIRCNLNTLNIKLFIHSIQIQKQTTCHIIEQHSVYLNIRLCQSPGDVEASMNQSLHDHSRAP